MPSSPRRDYRGRHEHGFARRTTNTRGVREPDPDEGGTHVGLTASLLLSAVGAILIWGINATVSGLDVHAIGAILLVVGIIGFVLSMFFWSTWGGFAGPRRATVVRDHVEY